MKTRQTRMRWLLVVTLVVPLSIAACGRKAHDDGDGGASAEAGGLDPDGVNAKDIERFPDETKIDHEAATLTQLATVRVTPPRGEPIVNIEAGTAVQKLASHGDAFLVSFTHPKTSSRTMGWIPQEAIGGAAPPLAHHLRGDGGQFVSADGGAKHDASDAHDGGPGIITAVTADAGAKHKTCAANFGLARLPDGDDCLQKCKTQADCPTKTFCTGATLVDPPGTTAKLCFKVSN